MNKLNPPKEKGWYWKVPEAAAVWQFYQSGQSGARCIHCGYHEFNKDSNAKGDKAFACFRCKNCNKRIKASEFSLMVQKGIEIRTNPNESNDEIDNEFSQEPENDDYLDNISVNDSDQSIQQSPVILSRKRLASSPIMNESNRVTVSMLEKELADIRKYITQLIKNSFQSILPNKNKDTTSLSLSLSNPAIREIVKENQLLKSQLNELQAKFDKFVQSSNLPQKEKNNNNNNTSSIISSTQKQPQVQTLPSFSRPSFASIAKSFTKPGDEESFSKVHAALRKCVGAKPPMVYTNTNAEVNHNLTRIFVQGFSRQPIRDIKSAFMSFHIMLSKIYSIDFIGKMTLEVTMKSDYVNTFIRKMNELKLFKVLPKVDPSKPIDKNASPSTAEAILKAFTKRIQNSYNLSNHVEYKAYLVDLAKETGINLNTIVESNPSEIALNLEINSQIDPSSQDNNQDSINVDQDSMHIDQDSMHINQDSMHIDQDPSSIINPSIDSDSDYDPSLFATQPSPKIH